jgi:hypothetical protein
LKDEEKTTFLLVKQEVFLFLDRMLKSLTIKNSGAKIHFISLE